MRQPTIAGMTNAEYLRHLRVKARAEGKCVLCRARPAAAPKLSCQECLDYRKNRRRKAVATKTVCVSCCCRRRRAGRKLCARCAEFQRIRGLSERASKRQRHECFRCSQPAAPGFVNCHDHMAEARERTANWYARNRRKAA